MTTATSGTQKIYRAKSGTPFNNDDAAIIGPELEHLAEQHGREIKPSDVVEAARHSNSPLHDYFEWSTERAARMYNIYQARRLLNSWTVDIVYEAREEQTHFQISGMVNVVVGARGAAARRYVPIESALENKDYMQQLARDAERRLKLWGEKFRQYRHLEDFQRLQSVFHFIDELDG